MPVAVGVVGKNGHHVGTSVLSVKTESLIEKFKISSTKIFDEFLEAKKAGIETRPVILGPITFLLLGKAIDGSNKLDLLDNLLESYQELFKKLQ